jgi:hypothetical protein
MERHRSPTWNGRLQPVHLAFREGGTLRQIFSMSGFLCFALAFFGASHNDPLAARRCWLGAHALSDGGAKTRFEENIGGDGSEEVHQRRYEAGPTGLVARPDTGTVVTMEIFVEQEVVAPVRILLEEPRAAENWPPAIGPAHENGGKPPCDLACHVEEMHLLAGAGRTSLRSASRLETVRRAQIGQTGNGLGPGQGSCR